MIQRYGLFGAYDDWKMEPDSDGEYVLFSDHVAEVERLRAAVARLQAERDDLAFAGRTLQGWSQQDVLVNSEGAYQAIKIIADRLAALAHPIADEERVAQGEGE